VGDTLCLDTNNSYIRSNSRLVATVGIDNLAVIETQDAVLVAPLDKSQQVKELVNDLKKRNRPEANLHNKVYRPWGTYESLAKGSSFQVKRIIVQPGEELSLQLHYHRAEHWIIVEGTAEVQIGDKIAKYTQNQSTYIPIGEIHRMRNPGKIPLVVIEVQSGQYLGEDDIVRFEDKYHRV
jgi:mannose-1-phosphate guanylyltransferase/mannose-6-phosphate isomerase